MNIIEILFIFIFDALFHGIVGSPGAPQLVVRMLPGKRQGERLACLEIENVSYQTAQIKTDVILYFDDNSSAKALLGLSEQETVLAAFTPIKVSVPVRSGDSLTALKLIILNHGQRKITVRQVDDEGYDFR